jgi:hypothetical protein
MFRCSVLVRMNDGAHEQGIKLELRPQTSVHADWPKYDGMERARYGNCVQLIYKHIEGMMLTDSFD